MTIPQITPEQYEALADQATIAMLQRDLLKLALCQIVAAAPVESPLTSFAQWDRDNQWRAMNAPAVWRLVGTFEVAQIAAKGLRAVEVGDA